MRSVFFWPNVFVLAACGSSDGDAPAAPNGGAGGATTSGPPIACTAEPSHTGEATYYTFADGSGNCGFDATPNDLNVGAMNATDYQGSAACGGCVTLKGPKGTLTIRIVDQCPECPQGNIDLSPSAFDQIADHAAGRVPITWTYVGCGISDPITYEFKDGSNQWWTAVQIRNSRFRVSKFEYQKDGAFVAVNRESYNYFVEPSGMGPGPYTFRVTDVYGDSIVDTGIGLTAAAGVPGKANFPDCK